MKKIILIFTILILFDIININAQRAFIIRKTDKSRVGFSTSNIDSITIADIDTLPASMFSPDTTYVYTEVKVTNIQDGLKVYNYNGSRIGLRKSFGIAQTVNNLPDGESGAVYENYLFLIQDKMSEVYMYDLRQNKLIGSCQLSAHNDVDASLTTIYNCGQASFGTLKFNEDDYFPLLYVSQRANDNGQCFVNVLRIVPQFNEVKTLCSSFTIQLVQTIYLPKATAANGLYEAKLTVNPQTGDFYVYSYNKEDVNSQVRISKFDALNLIETESTLNNPTETYLLNNLDGTPLSGETMKGSFIDTNKLYLTYGTASNAHLCVIDLKAKQLVSDVNLAISGFSLQPKACMKYKHHITLTANDNSAYTMYFQ